MSLDYTSYEEAKEKFRWSQKWELFDGTKEKFNIAHECVDRHPEDEVAIRIKFEDGKVEQYKFGRFSKLTSRFANFLQQQGIARGDKVALLLLPSLEYYVSMFGIFKRGAVMVANSPLFGPEALAFRLEKSEARAIVTTKDRMDMIAPELVKKLDLKFIFAEDLIANIQNEKDHYNWETDVNSLCMIQFSSGTTGAPKSMFYRHGAILVSGITMKFTINPEPEDTYFCPSSPAWGHGIWYGTIAPLIFGKAVGTVSGKFDPIRCLEALEEWQVTNMAAISSHYRLIMETGKADQYHLKLKKISYTGEPMPKELVETIQKTWGITPYTQYGTTEVGPIAMDYHAFQDYAVKPGSLGKAMIGGVKVAIIDEEGKELPAGTVGQVAQWRDSKWIKVGDSAYVDEEGYFWYVSRIDDVIISAGYTIGPIEVEGAVMKHPAVAECAVVGSPDKKKGEIVKAFITLKEECKPTQELATEIQQFVKTNLSKHEYPAAIEFVEALPKTPDGKLKRKDLKERERQKKSF